MTAFGKLLVFMNLVFSVITGALIVFVFTTRANWVGAYNDAKVKAEAAEKAYKSERGAHENSLKQKDAQVAGLQAEVTRLGNAVAAAQQEAQSARDLATRTEATVGGANTAQQKVQSELAQIKNERDALVAQQAELRQKVIDIQKQLDGQVEKAVLADLRSRNMEQKANNLLRQLEDLTVRNRELESRTLGGGVGAGTDTINVPKTAPSNVRGKVTSVGTGSNLAQVNIGSDSGLSVGTKLIVYRANEYLGDLTLVTVNPKEAVGKFEPARRGADVKKDDLVITSFTGVPQ
jgi:hypothetical protein